MLKMHCRTAYRWHQNKARYQHGLSIIEVMVAVTISLLLMLGLAQIMIGGKKSYRLQNASGVLQENARYTLQHLTYHLRNADHWGGVEARDVSGSPAMGSVPGGVCTAAWVQDISTGIQGFQGSATVPTGVAGCIQSGDYVPNSDVFVVRFADADASVSTASMTSAPFDDDLFVRTAVGERAQLQLGSDGVGTLPDQPGTYNFPFNVSMFFIRPCSTKSGAVCTAADDSGNPIPTLVRLRIDGDGDFVQAALVEGVEQMKVEYGIDRDNNGNAEQFDTADTLAAGDWAQVVSVRISLIVRSLDRDMGLVDNTNYLMLEGPNQFTYTAPTNAQMYPRKLFSAVIQIRNRIRG